MRKITGINKNHKISSSKGPQDLGQDFKKIENDIGRVRIHVWGKRAGK